MNKSTSGFTIVELLIVIVVIAILAAISVVAYSGIQDRANSSSAQAAARQISSEAQAFFIQYEAYPAGLANLSVSGDSGKYQYRSSNSTSPKTFCATATSGNKSFYVSSLQPDPVEGACPGHLLGGREVAVSLVSPSVGLWESGHYSMLSGSKEVYANRIRYGNLVPVETGTGYTQSTGHSSYQFVVRYYDSNRNFIPGTGGGLPTGQKAVVPSGASYMGVAIYSHINVLTSHETYQTLLQNGGLDPQIVHEG